jgi:endonuclease/exonuclease/phosphatase (EEP) superfamily protein YafD
VVIEGGHVPLLPSDPGPAFSWEGWENLAVRPLQYCHLLAGRQELVVANFHGTPDPPHKLDTPERIEQSRQILDVLADGPPDVILAGDFNLLPEAKSIAMLGHRFRNLVCEFAVPTTRSYLNPHRGTPQEQKFADYVFVSSGVRIQGFVVPDVLISDHLPLILSFSIE